MGKKEQFILWFNELGIHEVSLVGGKNASLGEMYCRLTAKGVSVPNGFAITAFAYNYLLDHAGIHAMIREALADLDTHDVHNLAERGKKVRDIIKNSEFPEELKQAITGAYRKLCRQYGPDADVAVRSSATAEDLPDASFAGQQDTYLNIKGDKALLEACKNCFASLFTNRAISYRHDKGFDHFKISLSIGVQKMVRSDKACSGVMFSIDTETGFRNAVYITGSYGLGENVVQGAVNPDEFYVFKPTLLKGKRPILSKKLGSKKIKMIYATKGEKPVKNIKTTAAERDNYIIDDDEILQLARWACIIEEHYSRQAGYFKPMDIEWAKDGITKKLFIVQARPETVQSQKNRAYLEKYSIRKRGKVLVTGKAVGSQISHGKVNIILSSKDIGKFNKGEVLVTDMTDPDWEPIMKKASAIVTNRGGRTCFTGDTKLLTNEGFMNFKDVLNSYERLYVPSLNRKTMKIEWRKITAAMKQQADVIEISTSQTGRVKNNTLRLTKDHKMLTFHNRDLVEREIAGILQKQEGLLLAQKIPSLDEATEKDQKLAYLLGAICTDGSVYLSRTHGEVQFIQKPTDDKKEFIAEVQDCFEKVFHKRPSVFAKKESSGTIRNKEVRGSATAYRCYSKQIAEQVTAYKLQLVPMLLRAHESLLYHFLAGVIDGDGSYSHASNRINIYCSNEPLLQAITVSCLRLGIVPQITNNRHIYNVQIVECIDALCSYTKRVKGRANRKIRGTRFFAAQQLLADIIGNVNVAGRIKPYVDHNLLIDVNKIEKRIMPLCTGETKERLSAILNSDTRMCRAIQTQELGVQDVYNITVEDNHNYIVFTDRYTPILVNNCHAAIVSRELGVTCIVGTENCTKVIKHGQEVTVSCAEGEEGYVYEGKVPYEVKRTNIGNLKRPKTKIMMNLANPDIAFSQSSIPNDGVGLARQEFIINEYIKIHPNALLQFATLKDKAAKKKIGQLTRGYKDKKQFFIDRLAQGISMLGAAFYPNDVIVRLSDFKTNEYANLIGGKSFEPHEENPMIGWRGASRYYDKRYKDAFSLECLALLKVRDEMGLTNVKVMVPFCRTVEEGKKVIAEMAKNGLKRGKNGLEVYVMCEIPSNVILADKFADIFDGFSIGSNDLTQLTLGLDRDSQLVSHLYNERNAAVKRLVSLVIQRAKNKGRKVGICGQAPSDFPDFAKFLVECGIDSISLNSDTVIKTTLSILREEKRLKKR